jgi:hypothetical protein
MPTKAVANLRSFLFLAVIGQGVIGCAGDMTAPAGNAARQPAALAPINASHALVGAVDGAYVFTIDPTADQSIELGPNHLDIPAGAICRIADTPYGAAHWDEECPVERLPVTITAVVTGADSDHPRIDFEPAMRFSPSSRVVLYMTLDAHADRKDWSSIFYCATGSDSCVDEAKDDNSLRTSVSNRSLFRRIKHFSGYIVLSREAE